MVRRNINSRLFLVFLVFIFALSFLIARLVYVQIFKSSQFKIIARDQHNIFTELRPQRGAIFDRNLKELAVNIATYSLYSTNNVQLSAQAGATGTNAAGEGEFTDGKKITQLTRLLNLDEDTLKARLDLHKNFVWLKRKVTPDVSAEIKDLNIPGIGQVREFQRFYPNSNLASHIIGFTNIDNKGLEGVELYADRYLAGIKGWRLAQQDAKRREVVCWSYKSILPSDGYNLVLTIDNVVQNIVERHLRQAARKYKATSATAIVMEPESGEILALYNYPDYDLNKFQDYPPDVRRNLAITDIFEPGSSFKFVTAAAALEENQVKIDDLFYCEKGSYRIGGRILHDYRPYGELSLQEVMEHSSNIGIVKIAQNLGEKALYNYIRKFGFGSSTGIDLPGEVAGIVRPPRQWSRVSMSSIPMGQEIAVTPIQMICAISCVANDGVLVKPKLLKYIQRQDGQIIKSFPTQEVRRVISVETAHTLKGILTACVENGTGKRAEVPRYKTAGKTGTAQKAKPGGGYYRHRYFASFVGFVPAEQPLIAILVVLNEPTPVYFGGTVAAPVFRKIATETLRYLEMSDEVKGIN